MIEEGGTRWWWQIAPGSRVSGPVDCASADYEAGVKAEYWTGSEWRRFGADGSVEGVAPGHGATGKDQGFAVHAVGMFEAGRVRLDNAALGGALCLDAQLPVLVPGVSQPASRAPTTEAMDGGGD